MQLLSLLANSHITTESFVHCARTINRQPTKFYIINQEVWAHDFMWMFLEDMLLVVNAPPLYERTASRFMTLWSVYFRAESSFKCKYWSIKWVYKAQSNVHFRLQMFPLDDTTLVIMHFWHIFLAGFPGSLASVSTSPRLQDSVLSRQSASETQSPLSTTGLQLAGLQLCHAPRTTQVTLKLNS